jgi:Domain of unknown function (DUF1905)
MKFDPLPNPEPIQFTSVLFTVEGKGGWTFVSIPAELAPPVMGAWGMTPVVVSTEGKEWATTVWREKNGGRSLLPMPKKIRGKKQAGDTVEIELRVDFTPRPRKVSK